MTDYEVLGIDTNADEKEIKKAYFRLIRTYSPEKDPEKFQQIRAAYERLSNPQKTSLQIQDFPLPDHAFANIYEQNFLFEMQQQNYKKAIQYAEDALKNIGENAYFLLCLASACEQAGKYTKAAKQYEKILKEYPENNTICGKLAITYYYRGFFKKAFPYFEKAYDGGERHRDFITVYIQCAYENAKFNLMEQLFLEFLEVSSNQDYRKNIPEYAMLFGLYATGTRKKYNHLPTIFKHYYEYAKAIQSLCKDYDTDLTYLFFHMNDFATRADALEDENLKKATALLREHCIEPEFMERTENIYMYSRINEDTRFSDVVKFIAEYFLIPFDEEYDNLLERFAKLDVKLCLIEEWEELKAEFSIIEREFSKFYHMLDDVWTALASDQKTLEHYKERLLKEHHRLGKNFSNSFFYDRHPEKSPVTEVLQWNSFETGTFQREEKKVGRNDPCPCGSGKKYKKCCGKDC